MLDSIKNFIEIQTESISKLIDLNNNLYIFSKPDYGKSSILKKLYNKSVKANKIYHSGCDPRYRNIMIDRLDNFVNDLLNKVKNKSEIILFIDELDDFESLILIKSIINNNIQVVICSNKKIDNSLSCYFKNYILPYEFDNKMLYQFYNMYSPPVELYDVLNCKLNLFEIIELGNWISQNKNYNIETLMNVYRSIKELNVKERVKKETTMSSLLVCDSRELLYHYMHIYKFNDFDMEEKR